MKAVELAAISLIDPVGQFPMSDNAWLQQLLFLREIQRVNDSSSVFAKDLA